MTGRKFHDFWEFGNFESVEYGTAINGKRKLGALCKICGTTLRNTAKLRMQGHRKICTPDKPLRLGDTTPVRVTLNRGNMSTSIKTERTDDTDADDSFNITTYADEHENPPEPRQKGAGGRKFHDFWIEGMFRSVELPESPHPNGKPKMGALCEICGSTMRNTAKARMMAHRNVCSLEKPMKYCRGRPSKTYIKNDQSHQSNEMEVDMIENFHTYSDDDLDLGNEEEDITPFGPVKQEPYTYDSNDNSNKFDFVPMEDFDQQPEDGNMDVPAADPTFPTVQIHVPSPPKRTESGKIRIDKESADESFAKFIFSSNVKYSLVDEYHFKNMLKGLNPSYKPPCYKTLMSHFLDRQYERQFGNAKFALSEESVLVMLDIKESTTLCVLYSANGKLGFLGLFRKTNSSQELFDKCTALANENFNTTIYAVSTNNKFFVAPENIIVLKNYSDLAIELAERIISDDIIYDINRVMQHFGAYEDILIKHGGVPLKLMESSTRREFIRNFLDNQGPMQRCLAMEKTEPPSDFFTDFFSSEYIKGVKTVMDISQQVLDNLEKKTQDMNYSVADAVEDFINFQVPDAFKETVFEFRKGIFDSISLAGNMLHPKYRGQHLSNIQKDSVDEFFLKNLNVEGLDSFQNLLHKECIFESLLAKEISSPMTFWRMAQRKHPNLSDFATKLLNIPASFNKIETLLHTWIATHSEFDDIISIKTGKLIHFFLELNYKINTDDE